MLNRLINKRLTLIICILLVTAISFSSCGQSESRDNAEGSHATTTASIDNKSTSDAIDTNKDGKDEPGESSGKSSSKSNSSTGNSNSESGKNSTNSGSSSSGSGGGSSSSSNIDCTISVDCKSAVGEYPGVTSKVSNNGVILSSKKISIKKGSSVYDALKASGLSFSGSTSYITSINGLSEKDCGKKSGWTFYVNGSLPMSPCGKYILKDGDSIQWKYVV